MALTADQDIPTRPREASEPWSARRLFPMRATATAIAKMFINPLEILLAWAFLVIGICTIAQLYVPITFYVLSILLLLSVLFERVGKPKVTVEGKPKKK